MCLLHIFTFLLRAFYGWLAHCRHLKTVRQNLGCLAFHDPVVQPALRDKEDSNWHDGIKMDWWKSKKKILTGEDLEEEPHEGATNGSREEKQQKPKQPEQQLSEEEQKRRQIIKEIEVEIHRRVYYGGIEPCIRKQVNLWTQTLLLKV